jgi:hypothetical protein
MLLPEKLFHDLRRVDSALPENAHIVTRQRKHPCGLVHFLTNLVPFYQNTQKSLVVWTLAQLVEFNSRTPTEGVCPSIKNPASFLYLGLGVMSSDHHRTYSRRPRYLDASANEKGPRLGPLPGASRNHVSIL